MWNPLDGTSKPVATFHREGRHTVIPLRLPAAGSMFVVFRPGEAEPALTRIVHGGKTWTINAPAADAPRRHAGLIGPVVLHLGMVVGIRQK